MIIRICGKKIEYTKVGNGTEVILLVHGWGGSIKSLSKIQENLGKEYTCISIDLPGFGESDMPEKSWGVDEYGEIVVSFLETLKMDSVTYVGHSFGGALGVHIASKYPKIIKKLILCAPSYQRNIVKEKGSKHLHTKLSQAATKLNKFPNIKTFVRRIYYKVFFPESELLRFPKLETNFKLIVSKDLTPQAKTIQQKTLILWGTLDKQVPIEQGIDLKNHIKNSEIIIYEKQGHGFPIEIPTQVSTDIKKFIKRNL